MSALKAAWIIARDCSEAVKTWVGKLLADRKPTSAICSLVKEVTVQAIEVQSADPAKAYDCYSVLLDTCEVLATESFTGLYPGKAA